jgi:PIG-X / PBN1
LHTYAASSNPELLAEEAEGEVVVVEFFDLLDSQNCQCNQIENKNDNRNKESDDKYKTGNMKGKESMDNEGSDNHDKDRNKRNNDDNKNHKKDDYDSNGEYEIEHENEIENENEMKNDNDSQEEEEEESVKRKRESDIDYYSFNTTHHNVHENHHKTVKRKNIRTIITDFNFQLPIHLRYHTPYDDFLPFKNTKTGEYPYHKKVIIPYPTVFIGMENCLQHSRKEPKNAKNVPRIKRIYDVSFLGQTGNVQSSMISENFYVKLNGFVDKKNYDNGNGDEEHGGGRRGGRRGVQGNEEEEEDKHERRQGQGQEEGEQINRRKQRQRVRGKEKDEEEGEKGEQDREQEGEEEQTIELKVPVGCYSNDFVLIVTIACYFFSSSAIVYSLVF